MVFSSVVFLLLFLPIVFIGNIICTKYLSNVWLLLASLFFYAWGEPVLVLVMVASILINYVAGILIEKTNQSVKKIVLILGVTCNLGILGYYKYAAFLAGLLNALVHKPLFPVPEVTLPIGISFFTFQAISYIADVYRGETKCSKNIIHTALYISFFPQLIAGPIVKFHDINEQIKSRRMSVSMVAEGFRRFLYGLSKKVLIANVLADVVDRIYAMEMGAVDSKLAWIAALFYTFQIYYDFSGYSDMAIGLGRMFGFSIPENFHYPYLSGSITEFWRRWHISLGSWFREYVYIPLGGNRRGEVRTYVNLIIVFFLTGLWHGANVTFIVWGMLHGLCMLIERWGFIKILKRLGPISIVGTFFVTCVAWVFFRADNLQVAKDFLSRMFLFWRYEGGGYELIDIMSYRQLTMVIVAIVAMGFFQLYLPEKIKNIWRFSVAESVCLTVLLIVSLSMLAANTYNPFIYFQF